MSSLRVFTMYYLFDLPFDECCVFNIELGVRWHFKCPLIKDLIDRIVVDKSLKGHYGGTFRAEHCIYRSVRIC